MESESLVALWIVGWLALGLIVAVVVNVLLQLFLKGWGAAHRWANRPTRYRISTTMDQSTGQTTKSVECLGKGRMN
jgi:hypothetical protein